jgi:DNA polymerase III subunit delta
MKLTAQRVEPFIRNPDGAIVVALLYGPDHGLIRERADRLTTSVTGDASDPFRVAELSADAMKDDTARLADEAAAIPFSGGRRVVRIRDGKDTLVEAVRNLLETGGGGGLVIIEAGELGPRSTLRQTCEAAPRAVALACYLDEGEALRKVIDDALAAYGLLVADDAADLLEAHLGADRGLTRNELEKLALYKGEPGRVSAEDVLAVVSGAGSISLDTVAYAACDGDYAALDRALTGAYAEGMQAIPLLRAMARHLQRLLQGRSAMARGASARQAVEGLKPPVFFRMQPAFRRQLEGWRPATIARALMIVIEAEMDCKRTGAPQELLCHRALLNLCQLGRSGRRDATASPVDDRR